MRQYNADVMITVNTIPTYGKLYKVSGHCIWLCRTLSAAQLTPLFVSGSVTHQLNVNTGGRGDLITYQPTLEQYISRCFEAGCTDHFGVGTVLSDPDERSVAMFKNRWRSVLCTVCRLNTPLYGCFSHIVSLPVCGCARVTIGDNALSVVYVPYTGWMGADTFTYSVVIGAQYSSTVVATVHVRKCRLSCSNDLFDDLPLYANGA